jgi:hypothetical protein
MVTLSPLTTDATISFRLELSVALPESRLNNGRGAAAPPGSVSGLQECGGRCSFRHACDSDRSASQTPGRRDCRDSGHHNEEKKERPASSYGVHQSFFATFPRLRPPPCTVLPAIMACPPSSICTCWRTTLTVWMPPVRSRCSVIAAC